MEALVEVQWWLFSSLFGLALSLSFPPSLPFSSVLPELLSSQINSPPSFMFSLPPLVFSHLCIYSCRKGGATYLCHGAG